MLPGVTVTMTQTDTQATQDRGHRRGRARYVISNLPTGPCRLEVSLQGFRSYVQNGIVLQVGATPTINVSLELGNVAETITVEGAAPLIDVKSSGIKDVVENERIVELPLQGRQVTDLIVLAGGAVNTGSPNSRNFGGCESCGGRAVNISVAGGLNFGVARTCSTARFTTIRRTTPTCRCRSRTRCRSSASRPAASSAQNGMHSGASVNAVTKSGTNSFHGNAFEFLRDHRFNATEPVCGHQPGDRQAARRRTAAQSVRRHAGRTDRAEQAVLLRRVSGHARRARRPSANIAFVPTAAMLAGDFTAFASPACNGGRQVGAARAVRQQPDQPGALQSGRAEPREAAADDDGSVRSGHLRHEGRQQRGQAVGKVDYQLTANHSIFGRYMATFFHQPAAFAKDPDNVLVTNDPGTEQPGAVVHASATR